MALHAYDRDLAFIHDAGYGDFARGAAPELLKILRDSGIAAGLVVDLGCGSGIWAAALVEAGYDVLGIDQSQAMLDIARRRLPGASLRHASLWAADIPPCAAATAIGECLNYRSDSATPSRHDLGRLLRRIHAALEPGGLFIFDVATPDRVPAGVATHFRRADGWACASVSQGDKRRRTLIRHITTFRRVGKLYRRQDEVHRLKLYTREGILRGLRQAGFSVHTINGYGETRLLAGMAAFVARKRLR